LCVLGADRLAAGGQSAKAILERYFPGLVIGTLSEQSGAHATTGTALRIFLPETEESDRTTVRAVATRARDELSAALGIEAPATITLRFHPTVEAYQRASGQPWFTTGATAGTESHFLPPSVLRQRGRLDRTIRHEIAHVLTAHALAGRPRWFVEGVAAYYAEAPSTDGATPSASEPCPSDTEFTRPTSADTLRNAYGRARACVARRLAAGSTWTNVR
jgi:hypothetical protein